MLNTDTISLYTAITTHRAHHANNTVHTRTTQQHNETLFVIAVTTRSKPDGTDYPQTTDRPNC